uniref:Uncharacterized protein n=1 Tax=Strigamia maritima TaxID=126957 RepID=T1IHW3_STRMM
MIVQPTVVQRQQRNHRKNINLMKTLTSYKTLATDQDMAPRIFLTQHFPLGPESMSFINFEGLVSYLQHFPTHPYAHLMTTSPQYSLIEYRNRPYSLLETLLKPSFSSPLVNTIATAAHRAARQRTRLSILPNHPILAISCLLFFAIVALSAGLFLFFGFNKFLNKYIEEKLIIAPGSAIYQSWIDPSVPIYLRIYLFNCTNGNDVATGVPMSVAARFQINILLEPLKKIRYVQFNRVRKVIMPILWLCETAQLDKETEELLYLLTKEIPYMRFVAATTAIIILYVGQREDEQHVVKGTARQYYGANVNLKSMDYSDDKE